MPNHVLCYLVVNRVIEIVCNDAICHLPKMSRTNVILVNIRNNFCYIVVA